MRRLFWLVMGITIGVLVVRKLSNAAARMTPGGLAESLAQTLGPGFRLVHSQRHQHATPWGSQQMFQFSVLRREG